MVDFSFGFFGGRDGSANGWQRSEEEFFFHEGLRFCQGITVFPKSVNTLLRKRRNNSHGLREHV
jgi:hypothetical protein